MFQSEMGVVKFFFQNWCEKASKSVKSLFLTTVLTHCLFPYTPGFFVEAGAFDGATDSNTLHFELAHQWSGLLVEPVKGYYKKRQ